MAAPPDTHPDPHCPVPLLRLHRANESLPTTTAVETGTATLLREPLGDETGLKFAFVVVFPQADHAVTILNIRGSNVVDRFAAVFLAGPFR